MAEGQGRNNECTRGEALAGGASGHPQSGPRTVVESGWRMRYLKEGGEARAERTRRISQRSKASGRRATPPNGGGANDQRHDQWRQCEPGHGGNRQ